MQSDPRIFITCIKQCLQKYNKQYSYSVGMNSGKYEFIFFDDNVSTEEADTFIQNLKEFMSEKEKECIIRFGKKIRLLW